MTAGVWRLVVLGLALAGAPGHTAETARQPFELVRTLESLQERIAQGSQEAHRYQRQFIAEAAEEMLKAPAEVWQDPRNVRAAVVYVLSGGDPRILSKLAEMPALPPIVPPELFKGVLAYAEGRNQDAQQLLSGIDPRALEARLGGHLALAKAMLTAPEDAQKALGFLDDARLLSPGTLVEEAALRRQILLLAKVEDYRRLEMLAFQYLRRFGRSVYAKNFYRSFAIASSSGQYGRDEKLLRGLEARLDELDEETRKQLYLVLAEEAIARGKVELTRMAADKIAYLFPHDSREVARLQLYKAAALLVTREYDFALAALRQIDRSRLSPGDAKLLDGALSLASQLRAPLPPADRPAASATQVKHDPVAETSPVLERARLALARAEELLSKERR